MIKYEDKEYEIQYHPDLIGRIASENNTFFEEWLLTPLKEKVKSFDFVIDVGANIGNHALFFKKVCKADRVVCFEPHPDNLPLLHKNCSDCEIYDVGISSDNIQGFLEFVNNMDHNSGTSKVSSNGHPIVLRTLDSYDFLNVTFIKIDVEGLELEVLRGAQKTIEQNHPDVMVEIHLGVTVEAVQALLPGYVWEKVSFEDHYLFTYVK
jgi:protein O-GlcNAc transferase